jgi:hypothetical protein
MVVNKGESAACISENRLSLKSESLAKLQDEDTYKVN